MSDEQPQSTPEQQPLSPQQPEQQQTPTLDTPPQKRKLSYRAQRSGSTSSAAVITDLHTQERKKSVHSLADSLFHDVSKVVHGEMQLGFNELKLLETMNGVVAKKYEGMEQRAHQVHDQVKQMKQLYEGFKMYFDQIDEIEKSIDELGGVVKYLDQYTRSLEIQLKPYL